MFQPNRESEEHNFWISYADLVTGFMIIFIVITMILFNRQEVKPIPISSIEIPVDTLTVDTTEEGTIGVLKEQFEQALIENPSLQNVMEITEDATIRFNAERGEELFVTNKPKPTYYFKRELGKFLPHYFRIIDNFIKADSNKFTIKEIRIEGHADSEGGYYNNLKLSSGRAISVQGFILGTNLYKKKASASFKEFIKQKTVAIGYSQTRLLDSNGNYIVESLKKEDKDKSRRVEFRVLIEKKMSDYEN